MLSQQQNPVIGNVSNILVWYRSDANNGTVAGDPLTVWTNCANNFFNLTNGGTAVPTNTAGVFGLYPSIRFDGVNDALQGSNTIVIGSASTIPWTMIIVGKLNIATTAGSQPLTFSSANRQIRLAVVSTNSIGYFNGSDVIELPSVGVALTNKFMAVLQATGTTFQAYHNLFTTNMSITGVTAISLNTVGGYPVFGNWLAMDTAEIIIATNNFVTGDIITNLFNKYFQPRYGL